MVSYKCTFSNTLANIKPANNFNSYKCVSSSFLQKNIHINDYLKEKKSSTITIKKKVSSSNHFIVLCSYMSYVFNFQWLMIDKYFFQVKGVCLTLLNVHTFHQCLLIKILDRSWL